MKNEDMARRRKVKRYRFKKRFWVILASAFLLIIVLLTSFIRGCSKEEKKEPSPPEDGQVDTLLTASVTPANDAYMNEVVYIGDSRTLGLATYRFVRPEQVLAEDALTHQIAREKAFIQLGDSDAAPVTIVQAITQIKPKRMVVSFGINGMSFMKESVFMKEYEALINELMEASPDSEIIIQSIYPVSKKKSDSDSSMSNSVIDRYNKKLLSLAEKKKIYYLNTSEKLKDDSGALASTYDAGDGVHINTKAYEIILSYVRAHPTPQGRGSPAAGSANAGSKDAAPSSSSSGKSAGKSSSSSSSPNSDEDSASSKKESSKSSPEDGGNPEDPSSSSSSKESPSSEKSEKEGSSEKQDSSSSSSKSSSKNNKDYLTI